MIGRDRTQYVHVKYIKWTVTDSGRVLNCDAQFTILSPLSFDGPWLDAL